MPVLHQLCSSCRNKGTKYKYPPIKKRGLQKGCLWELEKKLQLYEGISGYFIMAGTDPWMLSENYVLFLQREKRELSFSQTILLYKNVVSQSIEKHQHANALPSSDSGSPYDYFKQEEWSTEYLRYQSDSFILSGFSRVAIQKYMAQSPSKFLTSFRVS